MKSKNFCNISEIQQKLVNYSSSVFHYYFGRDMDSFVKLLDPAFVWIGSYHFQYTKGIEQFLEVTKEEQQEIAAEVFDEEYQILPCGQQLWVLHGKFSASAWKDDTYLFTEQRATLVWKRVEDDFKLIHLHCTMARDIPLQGKLELPETPKGNIRWYEYMLNTEKKRGASGRRILLRDTGGNIHYLQPAEIIYIRIHSHIATVYTGNEQFSIRKNLNQLLEELSFLKQVHRSWLVNPMYILELRRYFITLTNHIQIPIGKSRYNDVCDDLKWVTK